MSLRPTLPSVGDDSDPLPTQATFTHLAPTINTIALINSPPSHHPTSSLPSPIHPTSRPIPNAARFHQATPSNPPKHRTTSPALYRLLADTRSPALSQPQRPLPLNRRHCPTAHPAPPTRRAKRTRLTRAQAECTYARQAGSLHSPLPVNKTKQLRSEKKTKLPTATRDPVSVLSQRSQGCLGSDEVRQVDWAESWRGWRRRRRGGASASRHPIGAQSFGIGKLGCCW
jgi:hypothetical protein